MSSTMIDTFVADDGEMRETMFLAQDDLAPAVREVLNSGGRVVCSAPCTFHGEPGFAVTAGWHA